MVRSIDLHTHTKFSDGSFTPSELVYAAACDDINVISITDHDCVDGIDEAVLASSQSGVTVIPGIELTVHFKKEMHILGYFIDHKSCILKETLKKLEDSRYKEILMIIEELKKNAIEIIPEEIIEKYGSLSSYGIIEEVVLKGNFKSRKDVINKYFENIKVERKRLTPKEGIELIKKSGGLAVLAHPGQLELDNDSIKALINKLIDYGLDGIECFSSKHDQKTQIGLIRLAEELNLKITGGSDFHGKYKKDIILGCASNSNKIPYEIYENLMKNR